MRAGAWLRLTALVAAAGSCLAVVSGALQLDEAHRVLAALALPPLCALVAAAWVAHRRLLPAAVAALASFLAAALATGRPAHITFSALALAGSLVVLASCFRGEPVARASWRDYVTLTKPRIMTLLLLTGATGMVVGAQGWPGTGLFVVTLVGLALACGGASALNHVLDRDLDRHMSRTARRPVAANRVPPTRALEFGLALSALSFVLLASLVNVLTALLALGGNLFYVFVYTRWLKRSTPQNIVIGGAAGAVPPLVGWAAATGNVTVPALLLFAIVFFWTPPHFWALALLIRDDYAEAGVPMLPVVRGERFTRTRILAYSGALVAFTILPFVTGMLGAVYLASAILLCGAFLGLAARLLASPSKRAALQLYLTSLAYLFLLFAAMAADRLIAV